MPKVGMQPIRRSQLIYVILEAVDQVSMGGASIALIARLAGVSNGIISHYFQDKNGLLEATMRRLLSTSSRAIRERRAVLYDDSLRAHLRAIVEGNFDDSQVNGPAMKTWLAFWATNMHQSALRRLQRANDHRLYSNPCYQFRRQFPTDDARAAAHGLAALIDGLQLRGTLTGDAFDTDEVLNIAYGYLDQQLVKQSGQGRKPPRRRLAPAVPIGEDYSIARFEEQKLHIGDRYVEVSSGATFETINPANGEVLARVQRASGEDIERAVQSVVEGQKVWAAMAAIQRSRTLRRAVDILREHNDELAALETLDTGKPLAETCSVDIVTGADVLEYYAGLVPVTEGKQIPLREASFVYTRREPLSAVAGIGAWNYPVQIALWKFAPALAAGNVMIFKPSEITPLTALKLAKIYTEAGVPDGVFNMPTGSRREVGQWLTEHPLIEKISFTGGTSTGKKVMASASNSSLEEVTMEPGGKSPLIIFPDADPDRAADVAVMVNFFSSGQVCTNGTRMFIHRSQQARFEARVLERVWRIRLGDPRDESTNFGPLVSFSHVESVLGYIEFGKAQKARLLCGGERVTDGAFGNGAYVAPTVFTDYSDDMTIVREEIFGPVMSILVYGGEDKAIRRVNDTEYGLTAGVVTQDLARTHRAIHRLETGICWINTWGELPAEMPVGGYKQSDAGRENGLITLAHYTRIKSVQVELDDYASVF